MHAAVGVMFSLPSNAYYCLYSPAVGGQEMASLLAVDVMALVVWSLTAPDPVTFWQRLSLQSSVSCH